MNIAIIPARIGSKGVPKKNIKNLAGKPVISYTILAAQESKIFDEIFISTDSQEIVDICAKHNITVPFLRPAELALDKTPMLDVIKSVLEYYISINKIPHTITLLQPTSPFRSAEDISEAMSIFTKGELDSLISVKKVPDHYNPHWVYTNENGNLKLFSGADQPIARRQDLPSTFIREGSIYIFKTATVKTYNNIYGKSIGYYRIDRPTVNIDTPQDFSEAENLMKNSDK